MNKSCYIENDAFKHRYHVLYICLIFEFLIQFPIYDLHVRKFIFLLNVRDFLFHINHALNMHGYIYASKN